MIEIFGDLFAYHKRPGHKICITTNGFIKKDGTGVMGAGCAREAVDIDSDLPSNIIIVGFWEERPRT